MEIAGNAGDVRPALRFGTTSGGLPGSGQRLTSPFSYARGTPRASTMAARGGGRITPFG